MTMSCIATLHCHCHCISDAMREIASQLCQLHDRSMCRVRSRAVRFDEEIIVDVGVCSLLLTCCVRLLQYYRIGIKYRPTVDAAFHDHACIHWTIRQWLTICAAMYRIFRVSLAKSVKQGECRCCL